MSLKNILKIGSYLVGFIALVTLILLQYILIKHNRFSFDLKGIKFYFETMSNVGTFAMAAITLQISTYVVDEWEISKQNMKDRILQEKYNDWREAFKSIEIGLDNRNPYLHMFILQNRFKIFTTLHEWDFNIDDNQKLITFLSIFLENFDKIETSYLKYEKFERYYPDDTFSYSYSDLSQLIDTACLKTYSSLYSDLKTIFASHLPQDRKIHLSKFCTFRKREDDGYKW